MRILLDTNVAITYVSGRDDPFSKEADVIMRMCAEEKIEGVIALHSLSTIWYCARKLPEQTRRDWILQLCTLLTVVGADNSLLLEAIQNTEFKDFEDAMQDCCARNCFADYIVTANIKDYQDVSKIPAITPGEFLELHGVSE